MSNRPNILIFMTDHQRAETVLPDNPCRTPNVEQLAKQGVTFTNAFCPTPHCCPARAAFFSGEYPSRSGIWNNVQNRMALGTTLNPGIRLFSENLREAGYDLAFSGKWHVCADKRPSDYGWRELYATCTGTYNYDRIRKWMSEAAQQPEPRERRTGEILRPGYGPDWLYGLTERTPAGDDEAVERALRELPKLADSGKPWALYVGTSAPHAPYMVPQAYLNWYRLEDTKLPASFTDKLEDKPRYYKRLRNQMFDQLTELETRDAIRHFRALCTYLDEQFGRLLEVLDATGQSEDTIVLYTADHADYCGDHGLFHKGVPAFRGAYNVPAVVRWPSGARNPGRTVDAMVSLADFAPTFVEAAGESVPHYGVGRSLVGFLRDEPQPSWRQEMWGQMNGVESYFTQRSIWTKDLKYVYNPFDFDELYDLRRDPDEMTNLADSPDYREAKLELVERMWRFAHEQDDGLAISGTYITVSLAPAGPIAGLRDKGRAQPT